MDNKNHNLTKWEKFLRIAKVLETIAIVLGVTAIFVIPFQIAEMENNIKKNSFDLLIHENDRLSEKQYAGNII